MVITPFKTVFSALALLAATTACSAAEPLPQLVIDKTQTTVSGLSSGGYMAVQLHVAHSATFAKGAGIVAGGPYDCAEGSLANATGRCTRHSSAIPVSRLQQTTRDRAAAGAIDPVANLQASRLYLFSGTLDDTVVPAVMDDLATYYGAFVPQANVVYRSDIHAQHAMVTDDYGNACSTKASPYINDCDFDLAGAMLAHLYGTLSARNAGTLGGRFVEYDQTPFVTNHGMAATGWAYVPANCEAGATCRLHVALHGCLQNTANVGQQWVLNTGYNRWADSNSIVVLYPQTSTAAINSCWDWWGYDSANYARKSGPQIAAIKAMVDRVSGAAGPPPDPGAACFTSSNYAHTTAGRAYAWYGYTYARGSNEYMGLWNVYVTTTLKQSGPNHYVIGTCP